MDLKFKVDILGNKVKPQKVINDIRAMNIVSVTFKAIISDVFFLHIMRSGNNNRILGSESHL